MRSIRLVIFSIFASAAMLLTVTAIPPEAKAQSCTTTPLDLMCDQSGTTADEVNVLTGIDNSGNKNCVVIDRSGGGGGGPRIYSGRGCSECPFGTTGFGAWNHCRGYNHAGSSIEPSGSLCSGDHPSTPRNFSFSSFDPPYKIRTPPRTPRHRQGGSVIP